MHTIRRSCQQALHARTAFSIPTTIRRAFSQTPIAHRGTLPVFLPASTPELSELLTTLNKRVLLPCHLTKDQKKLVYHESNRTRIEAEPIEITLGDVTLPLEHLDLVRDQPNRRRQLYDIIKHSKTREDWENVIRVVEGYENAGIHMKPHWQQRIVRHMNEAGMQHLVLKVLQRVSVTGIRLRDWGVVVQVLRAIRERAALGGADWGKDELVKALKMAEQVVELMENDEHLGGVKGDADHRTHPAVIAAPLEMAAELAYRHEGDTAKVKKYAARLMKALEQKGYFNPEGQNDITRLHTLSATLATQHATSAFPSTTAKIVAFHTLLEHIDALLPIWNALSTTRTVLEDSNEMPMPQEAEAVQKAIWAALERGLATLESMSVGGPETAPGIGFASAVQRVKESVRMCLEDGEEV